MAGIEAVEVYWDAGQSLEPVLMGTLHRQPSGKGEVLSFKYAGSWLDKTDAFTFDPNLTLDDRHQYPSTGSSNFGMFRDSSPDRWGQVLMQRWENLGARKEGVHSRRLMEWDFLLGACDKIRLGALRFKVPGGPYLSSPTGFGKPPVASPRELQLASLQFERHLDDEEHPDYAKSLAQLVAPGSSLGGARPKASVRDKNGILSIAKFPSQKDTRDIGAWELVAHSLARQAGIQVPNARALHFAESAFTTFLVERFDRTENGRRIAFVSAMTLTKRKDGEVGASYLELIDLLRSHGANTAADCEQLFRRVLLSIRIHNTDDHLRNHGFLVDPAGIRLSPAYDINPTVDRRELSLAIDETVATCDVSVAMSAHKAYGISAAQADAALKSVEAAVTSWRTEATRFGITRAEQSLMAAAFE
jgi:serine/threonine-protein kinase HipA